jgi:hypothetical protein
VYTWFSSILGSGGSSLVGDLVTHALDAPLANICVLAGLAFLAIAVVGNITGKIEPGRVGRIVSGALGLLLLSYGLAAHSAADRKTQAAPSEPTVVERVKEPVVERVVTPMQVDTDLFGGDYEGFDSSGPDTCQAACKSDAKCKAWTYVKAGVQGPQARCYLKNVVPSPTANPCCISGSVK